MKNKPVLKTENLCFSHYRQPLCIKDLNIELDVGDKLLVLAAKGQGKTTLLQVLSGFENKFFGNIFYDGVNLKTIPDQNKNVSLLLSEPVLINSSIRKNIDFVCETFEKEKLSKQQLDDLLKEFEILKSEETKIKRLSLFEKRSLALLRAFVRKSKIVFIDDYFDALLEEEQLKMQKLLKKILDTSVLVCSAGEKSFLKNLSFFEEMNFSKVLFLSFAQAFEFNSINEIYDAKINIDLVRFSHETKIYEGLVLKQNNEFFFTEDGKLLFKFSKQFESKFETLKMENEETEKVYLCSKSQVKFAEVGNEDFNKNIENGEFSIYFALTGEYVI